MVEGDPEPPSALFDLPVDADIHERVELYTGELSAEALAERVDRYFSDL